jgi:hypothetical protein
MTTTSAAAIAASRARAPGAPDCAPTSKRGPGVPSSLIERYPLHRIAEREGA